MNYDKVLLDVVIGAICANRLILVKHHCPDCKRWERSTLFGYDIDASLARVLFLFAFALSTSSIISELGLLR